MTDPELPDEHDTVTTADDDQRARVYEIWREITGIDPKFIVKNSGTIWAQGPEEGDKPFTLFAVKIPLTPEQFARVEAIFEEE